MLSAAIYSLDKHSSLFFVSFQVLVQSLDLPKSPFSKNIFSCSLWKNIILVILLPMITWSAGTLCRVQGLSIGLGCCWRVSGRVREQASLLPEVYTRFFLNREIQLCRYSSVRKDTCSGLMRCSFLAASGFHHLCVVLCVFGSCKCRMCLFPFTGYFS